MYAFLMILFCLFPMYPHTETDVQILGDTMWLENPVSDRTNQDQMDKMMLTGAVVLNRMESDDKWWHLKGEKTVYDVVFAPGQYAKSTKNGIGKTDTPEWVYELAEEMLNYGIDTPKYVIYQSMQPGLGTVWKRIGTEYFATGGGHKNEGADYHPTINSHYGRDIRIFDYVWGNPDRAGIRSSIMDYIRWHGYIRNLVDLAMAYRQGNGVFYP